MSKSKEEVKAALGLDILPDDAFMALLLGRTTRGTSAAGPTPAERAPGVYRAVRSALENPSTSPAAMSAATPLDQVPVPENSA